MYSSDGTDAEPHREEKLIDVAPIDAASDQHLWPFGKTYLVGGWPSPLKNDGVKVSWDDSILNWMESHKIPWFQTTNQSNIAIENCHL